MSAIQIAGLVGACAAIISGWVSGRYILRISLEHGTEDRIIAFAVNTLLAFAIGLFVTSIVLIILVKTGVLGE